MIAAGSMSSWRRRPIPISILTVAPGTWRRPPSVPTRRSRPNSRRSAARAQGRGGLAAAAAFLDRAAQLSLDPAPLARRALAAAQAKYLAGAPEAAGRLLLTAEAGPPG